MKNKTTDIYEMLDTLSLPVAAQRFAELSKSPEFGSYTALQFMDAISGLKQTVLRSKTDAMRSERT